MNLVYTKLVKLKFVQPTSWLYCLGY